MREILFRGKRIDNGEWVYGDIIHNGVDENNCLIQYKDGDSAICMVDIQDKLCLIRKVYASTIGQYTGLTDNNGVKIFEGDIVRYGDTTHRVVFERRNGTAYFGLVYGPEETLPFGHYQDLKQIEVIDNIYDNTELIKRMDDA